MYLELTGKYVKERITPSVPLIRHNEQKKRLCRVSDHKPSKCHNKEVEALSWNVLVHGCKKENILWKAQCLTGHLLWNRTIQRTVYGMREDVNGARSANGAEVLLPALCKTEDAFHIPVEDIHHGLWRMRIREVQIGPYLKGAHVGRLSNGFEIRTEDREVIVEKHHVRFLRLESCRKL
jgi:hypothetical protein